MTFESIQVLREVQATTTALLGNKVSHMCTKSKSNVFLDMELGLNLDQVVFFCRSVCAVRQRIRTFYAAKCGWKLPLHRARARKGTLCLVHTSMLDTDSLIRSNLRESRNRSWPCAHVYTLRIRKHYNILL